MHPEPRTRLFALARTRLFDVPVIETSKQIQPEVVAWEDAVDRFSSRCATEAPIPVR